MPTISVIVPVYKVENYIHRCVDSILNQTCRDFELILIDDGSPDTCGIICDEYAAKDNRVVVIHQENGGLSAARNAGLDWMFANSDSQWLTFVDSDDYLYSEYLERMYNAVIQTKTRICSCNATQSVFSDNAEEYIPKVYPTEFAYCDWVILRHRIPAWAKLYHRDLWNDIRFPVGRIHEDRFTTHKILFQVPQIATIMAPMYYVTLNPNSITHVKWTPKRMDHIDAAEEELSFFVKNCYQKAALRTAASTVHLIAQTIGEIADSDESPQRKKEYISSLRKKLRKYITQYKRALNINVRDYRQIYDAAFPIQMQLLSYWHAILRKLKLRQ